MKSIFRFLAALAVLLAAPAFAAEQPKEIRVDYAY